MNVQMNTNLFMNNSKNTMFSFLPRVVGAKFFLLCLGTMLISSCDESSVVGLDVQPEGDLLNVGFTDTLSLQTKTVAVDSIRTDEDFMIGTPALLGKYIDPVFGTTTSSIYTQLRLTANISPTSFGTAPVCDSIVLALVYDGTGSSYGKQPAKKQTLNVYKLSDDLKRDKVYYSDTTVAYSGPDLANAYQFTPRPTDSVTVGGIKLKPQARIPLDQLFGQTILNNQSTGLLVDNETFQSDFLKGFYITTENSALSYSNGSIVRFKMDESRMIVYYHNSTENGKSFDFNFSSVARFLNFGHQYATGVHPQLTAQLNGTSTQSDIAFIQGIGGVKVQISTPYLMSMLDSGKLSINKAELVIRAVSQSGTSPHATKSSFYSSPFNTSVYQLETFSPPSKLILAGINADGSGYDLPDAQEGSNYYGGNYNSETKEYRFNIARYVQQVLDGARENNGLFLVIPPLTANAYPNRIVIGGGASGPYQMKMNITYTKLQ
jgi:hypothetical protein